MRKVKLKSKGSGPLVIENASLLGRSAISVEVNAGEVKVVRTGAFNPALTIEQLMKQALSRVHRETLSRVNRVGSDTEFTWQVDCESLSFAVETAVYRSSLLDLDDPVENKVVVADGVAEGSSAAQVERLSGALLDLADQNALVLVEVTGTALSMSFRLDASNVVEKLSEIVGELTRDGTDSSKIRLLVYPATIRSRRELGNAKPIGEFPLVDTAESRPVEISKKTLRELNLSDRYRAGLSKWLQQTDAKLLLLDSPSSFIPEADLQVLILEIRGNIGVERMCLILETEQPETYIPVPADKIPEYDRLQSEFRRRAGKARLIDWIGIEAELAKVFSQLPDSRRNGLTEKDFILSSSRYRCLSCQGEGVLRSKMGPFGEVRSRCDVCSMTGFGESVLQVKFVDTSFRGVLIGDLFLSAGKFTLNDQLTTRLRKFCVNDLRQLRLVDSLMWLSEAEIHALIRQQAM